MAIKEIEKIFIDEVGTDLNKYIIEKSDKSTEDVKLYRNPTKITTNGTLLNADTFNGLIDNINYNFNDIQSQVLVLDPNVSIANNYSSRLVDLERKMYDIYDNNYSKLKTGNIIKYKKEIDLSNINDSNKKLKYYDLIEITPVYNQAFNSGFEYEIVGTSDSLDNQKFVLHCTKNSTSSEDDELIGIMLAKSDKFINKYTRLSIKSDSTYPYTFSEGSIEMVIVKDTNENTYWASAFLRTSNELNVAYSNPKGEVLTETKKAINFTITNIYQIINDFEIQRTETKTLNDYTWEEINKISTEGKAQVFFNVGDTKKQVINGQEYTFEILGFNHDKLANGNGNAGITFGMKEIFTNRDMGDQEPAWGGTALRTYLASVYSNMLPSSLKQAIKSVLKKSSEGYGSENVRETADNLFLLSEVEITGQSYNSAPNEGYQYELYHGTRYSDWAKGSNYWTRSIEIGMKAQYIIIDAKGYPILEWSDNYAGVSFAFCI